MEIKYVGRVLPSTGKQHQNQEVASGGCNVVTQINRLQRSSESVGEKMNVKLLMTMPNMYEHNGRLYSVGGGMCTLSTREHKDPCKILIRKVSKDEKSDKSGGGIANQLR